MIIHTVTVSYREKRQNKVPLGKRHAEPSPEKLSS